MDSVSYITESITSFKLIYLDSLNILKYFSRSNNINVIFRYMLEVTKEKEE